MRWKSLPDRLRATDPLAWDVLLAVGLAILALAGSQLQGGVGEFRPTTLLGIGLVLLQTLPLALRQRYPLPVLVVTGVAAAFHVATGERTTAATLGVLFALYTVAAHTDLRKAVQAYVLTLIVLLAWFGVYLYRQDIGLFAMIEQLLTNYLVFGVAWVLGRVMRSRRQYLAELVERNRQLEEEREENARLAVADERARIARELHDVVAHHLSVIAVQTVAARRVLEGRGALGDGDDPARGALDAVEKTSRETLTEMRRMLGLLRTNASEDRVPQPGLDRLDGLLTQVRDAGLPVELVVEGTPRELPAGIDLSAYRIVQEALTNSLRHAGRAKAVVRLRYGDDDLEVEVVDDGRGAAAALVEPPHHGHGIVGMRERVGLIGGQIEVGPRMAGGFAVTARLPLDVQPS